MLYIVKLPSLCGWEVTSGFSKLNALQSHVFSLSTNSSIFQGQPQYIKKTNKQKDKQSPKQNTTTKKTHHKTEKHTYTFLPPPPQIIKTNIQTHQTKNSALIGFRDQVVFSQVTAHSLTVTQREDEKLGSELPSLLDLSCKLLLPCTCIPRSISRCHYL